MSGGARLTIFVATRVEDVPAGCRRYASVDGSVPGAAVTWDHHVTGEPINLDAMPDVIDAADFDGVGTTMADTDAVASVVAVLFGGKSRLPPHVRTVLEAASHRCDQLTPHPKASPDVDREAVGFHAYVSAALLAASPDAMSETFARLCREVAEAVAKGRPLHVASPAGEHAGAVARLEREGRLRRVGRIALVDLRGVEPLPPEVFYAECDCAVGIFVEEHRLGGVVYTVGVSPMAPDRPADLGPALAMVARAEFSRGPPALLAEPGPGSENWGGRATVFGSPWNYGSRLSPDEVLAIVARAVEGA